MTYIGKQIIGIPFEDQVPPWQSSTATPEEQLHHLGALGFVDGFRDYVKDGSLESFIEGKRIAFVCPSPHLEGSSQGSFIDSYDLVVRVNQSFHVPEEKHEDYGSRTDILMNCMNINKIHAMTKNLDFARSLKYIICPQLSMWDLPRVEKVFNAVGTPWHNVCDGYLFKINKEVGTTCNTGLAGIITLLNYDIKELYVTGMTFFNMNTFGKVYFDEYHDEAVKYNNFRNTEERIPPVSDLRMDIHNQQPQIEYFKKIVKKYYNGILSLDNYLKQNFVFKEGKK